jgi:hypothetical protein
MLAAEKVRSANSLTGSIGSFVCASQARKAIVAAVPAMSMLTTSALPQPAVLARTRPQTTPSMPAETRRSPARSGGQRGCGSRSSGRAPAG